MNATIAKAMTHAVIPAIQQKASMMRSISGQVRLADSADVNAAVAAAKAAFPAWADTSPAIGKIKYTMIGDPSGLVTNNFDVMRPGVGLADRGAFVVDPEGVIQVVEITAEGIGRNAAELLRKVKAAQYVASHPGEVCPAKWEEGQKTLAPSLDLVGKI